MIVIKKSGLLLVTIIIVSIIFLLKIKIKKNVSIETSALNLKYEILVDVEESTLYVFEDNNLYKTYTCSGGKWSTPSPVGTWKIIQKDTWGEGFGGRWMGLNVPWGDFGIHRYNISKFTRLGKLTWMY